MIIFWLFVKYFAAFLAVVVFYEWLAGWLGGVTTVEAVRMFIAAFGVLAGIIVLMARRRGGFIIAVAIVLFWSLVIFGASGETAIIILAIAAAVFFAGVIVTIAELFMTRWQAARKRS